MPRLEPIQNERASEQSRELLEIVKSKYGMVPNLVRTMAHSPATLGGYLALSGAVAEGTLSAREREQIALTVSEINGCRYCLAAHSAVGKLAGLSELELLDARRGNATSSREGALLELAAQLVEQRGRVTDAALGRARGAGISDAEITEVVATVALITLTNYMNLLSQTEIDFPKVPALETQNA